MIFVLVGVIVLLASFLGAALLVSLSEGVAERQEWAVERAQLLALIQFPTRPVEVPKSPSQDLSREEKAAIALEHEQQEALAKVFSIVGTIEEDDPNVSK